jgi:hypothetical protein
LYLKLFYAIRSEIMNKPIYWVFITLSAVFLLSSCATMTSVSQKFTPQTKANIGIFADQTISMLSDANFGFARNESLYIREFFVPTDQEEQDVLELRKEAEAFFTRIVQYSLALVLIAETKVSESERVAAYHGYVSNMKTQTLENLKLGPDRYDDIIKRVGEAEKFLVALQMAQPIINAATRYMHQILDRTDMAIDVLTDKLDRRIDQEYAEVIHYQESLEEEKYNVLRSLSYLYGSYKGNMTAYEALAQSESIHKKDLITDPPPSDEDLIKIAEFLRNRLKTLHVIENEIKSDWDNYRAAHRELDNLHEKAKRDNSKARLIILVWLRAHQKMASGVASPAEWFDIKSLPANIINTGAKTIF